MSHREVLKNVVKFGKREFAEKKPLTLKDLRIKSKSILKRGMLPSLNVKQIGMVHFLIVADYNDYFRIYDRTGSYVHLVSNTVLYHKNKQIPLLVENEFLRYHDNL